MKLMVFCFLVFLLTSCGQRTPDLPVLPEEEERIIFNMANSYFLPLHKVEWNKINSQDQQKILLGKKLFYDKKLSKNQSLNCASCHDMNKFGQDNLRVSPGDGGEFGLRNAPTVLNASLQYAQFWDVREDDVEAQAALPIFGQREMGMTDTLELLRRISVDSTYPEIFERAFPEADTLISLENIKKAIGAFERTLLTPSRFDQYLQGDIKALNSLEKKGLKSFLDQGCIPCHSGVLLGGNMAQKFSVFGYYWDYTDSPNLDKGVYENTQKTEDKFVFKAPGLRNIVETKPYLHDGSVESLEECIRIMSLAELNLEMEETDVESIAKFFQSLTGEVPEYAFEQKSFPFE